MCKCENVQMLNKCANVQMCKCVRMYKCENVQMVAFVCAVIL